jgi:hypothetical protein
MEESNALERQTAEVLPEHVHWTANTILKDKGLWGFGIVLVLAIGPVREAHCYIDLMLNPISVVRGHCFPPFPKVWLLVVDDVMRLSTECD